MKNIVLIHVLNMTKRLIPILIFQCLSMSLLLAANGNAQVKGIDEVPIQIGFQEAPLKSALAQIEKRTGYSFVYTNLELEQYQKISLVQKKQSLYDLLVEISQQANLEFMQVNHNIHVKKPSSKSDAVTIASEEVDVVVRGTVVDSNGQGLPGVTVSVPGTSIGTATDLEGNYSLSVSEGATLVFSFIGFESQRVAIGDRSVIDITLLEDMSSLQEVVVIGYGTVKKSDLTGSVGSVDSELIHSRPLTNAADALQGRIPGVQVMNNSAAPGGNFSIRIRGSNSISATNEPLYVIDGIIGVGGLQFINPNDIESIEVLKDASATSIYGARGANGVVLISTKRGKEGKPQITYDSQFGFSTMSRKIPMLNASQYMQMENEAYLYSGLTPQFTQEQIQNPEFDTDWQDEATRTAFRQNHQIGVYGGTEQSKYGISAGYLDEEGIMLNSKLERANIRINLDNNLSDKLTLGTSLSLNHSKDRRIDTDNGGLNASRAMLEMFPFLPVKYEDGTYSNSADHPGGEGTDNPVAILNEIEDYFTITRTLGNIFLEYEVIKDLKVRISGGADINYESRNYYSPRTLRRTRNTRGMALRSNTRELSWQNENTISYQKILNDRHDFNAIVGITWQQFRHETFQGSTRGLNDDFFKFNNLGVGDTPLPPTSNTFDWALNSYLGRLNYILDKKYLFTVSARMDGSSKFGASNKYGFFPSGAFAWRISDEGFLDGQEIISDLKLRTSYGVTGNQEIGVFNSISSLATYTYIIDGQRTIGLGPGRIPNPDLKWEKTSQGNVGLDVGLVNNRLSLTIDAYYKQTNDLLLNAPLPYTTGYESIFRNIGRVENRGIEFMLSSVNVDRDFQWTTDANISFNDNKVLELGPEGDDIFPGPGFVTQTNILRVGQPIGSLWGWTRLGIFQNEQEVSAHGAQPNARPGDIKYLDLNGDGVIDSQDQTIIGNTAPKFIFGFINSFIYKNFDLIIEIQGVHGNDVMNLNPIVLEDRQTQANSYATLLDRWTPENPSNTIARVRKNSDLRLSTRHVEDGSFIRGRNISLGYNFNLQNKEWINTLKVFASAQNFFLISDYGGYDPEVSTYGGNFGQGIEFSSYPTPRTFTLGLS
ncbi:MAG TPA: TonB-dependent receptor, partial [Lunatimonas sp.]|nr:TonB-dependent receptor [Lunatimonas sp.]